MTVSLRFVIFDTLDAVAALTVAAPQRGFVAANLYSLAQAAVMPGQIPRAVYADETPVGFVMYGFDTDEDAYCISRLMVDQAYQGKGYGRQAMALVLDDIRARQPRRGFAYISFEPHNTAARALYESLGFVPDGRVEDGELIYRIAL